MTNEYNTSWDSVLDNLRNHGITDLQIETGTVYDFSGTRATELTLRWTDSAREHLLRYQPHRTDLLRADLMDKFATQEGDITGSKLRRAFPFDISLGRATGQTVFAILGKQSDSGQYSFEGMRAKLLGYTDTGIVLGPEDSYADGEAAFQPQEISFELLSGAYLLPSSKGLKRTFGVESEEDIKQWIMTYPAN